MTILEVAFFREIIGWIDTEGPENNWKSANTPLARFLENSHPGELPNTFRFLEAEGWLAQVLHGQKYVASGIRFLSNLTVMEQGVRTLEAVGIDTRHALLEDATKEGVFTGVYKGPASVSFTEQFEQKLSKLWENSLMPKFSGAQVKIPVSLLSDENGSQVILPAVSTPFTHILKVPREGFLASLPTIEWLGLELSKRAGLTTAVHALVEMPDGMAPSLVVERFDIPDLGDNLTKLPRISDFCNITGLNPKNHKYGTDVSICFEALAKQSSDPERDKIALFERIVLSHYIRDMDMHLKNISVLKTFDTITGKVDVKFAPVYDALTTTVYPMLDDDKQSALNFDPNPEHGGLRSQSINSRADLMKIAEMNDISWETADTIIDRISQSVADNAVEIAQNPPDILKNHPACLHALNCAATEIISYSDAPNVPEWDNYTYAHSYEAPPKALAPRRAFNNGPHP